MAGAIPSEIGNLQNLEFFDITSGGFSCPIPFEIFNISTILYIGLTLNNLSGHLPSTMANFLPNLQQLYLGANQLSGIIPSSISNASQLSEIELAYNSFSGLIPNTLDNLRFLRLLNLQSNNLTIESSAPELSFFTTLSNSSYLEILLLSDNPLNGILPSSVGNLSTSLEYFGIGHCNINGNIPIEIGDLSSLTTLFLDNNQFAGPIPTAVGKVHKLQALYLQNNKLEGSIPSDLCNLESLVELNLTSNELTGGIPECMGNLISLRNLYLAFNQLTSMIPLSLWNLTHILEVNLSSNLLDGSLPMEMGNVKVLRILDLSRNQLSGGIPTTIGGLKDLVNLSLAYNQLEGSIPEACGELVSLEFLDLSNNMLSGEIPKSLEALVYLKHLNVSFNRLQGKIPTGGQFENFSAASFMSNSALCGAHRLQVPPCKEDSPLKKKTTVAQVLKYLLPAIGSTILLIVALVLAWTRRKKQNGKVPSEAVTSPPVTWRLISHQQLVQATERFSLNNLLGEGSFGSVYKRTLSDGMDVAIKVLNLQVEGAFKSFDAECEVLRNTRHRNLIKIISICSNIDFKAFVLEYMPNGNLEKWLYSHNDHYLNILQRINIMVDVASALEYLHYGYSISIVHCDLKPSNILLDEDLVAHVADFGMAKRLGDGDSMMRTMTLATIGYMAPEYGSEGIISTRGDVYSYGILLMETFTRKRPTEDMFSGEMSLKRWIEESLLLSETDIIDGNLLRNERGDIASMEELLFSILRLALDCCVESPEQRINIKNVSDTLRKIKLKFLQDRDLGN